MLFNDRAHGLTDEAMAHVYKTPVENPFGGMGVYRLPQYHGDPMLTLHQSNMNYGALFANDNTDEEYFIVFNSMEFLQGMKTAADWLDMYLVANAANDYHGYIETIYDRNGPITVDF